MTTDTLELPPIDATMVPPPAARTDVAVAAGQAIDLEKVDLKKLALARFGAWSAETAATKAELARTVLDLSNQSRVDEAKSLRQRKINTPLATARATAKGLKSKLADTSRAVGEELEAIEKAWADVATAITPQIEAAQARIDEAARVAAEAEEQRKAEIREHIKVIRGYLERCRADDMTAARVANGMAALESLVIDKAIYQEFEKEANEARAETLAGMQRLREQLTAREAEAARQEAIRLENERMARELAEAQARINAEAEELRRRAAELAAAEEAARQAEADRQEAARVSALAQWQARQDAEAQAQRERAAALEAVTATEYTEGQAPQQVLKAEAPGPDATDRGEPANASPRVGAMGAGQPADAGPVADTPVEPHAGLMLQDMDSRLSKALASTPGATMHAREAAAAIAAAPAPMVAIVATPDIAEKVLTSPLKLAQDLEHAHALLRDALALVEHATAAFSTRFPTQPKPSVEWWAELREKAGALQPKLLMTLAVKQSEAA